MAFELELTPVFKLPTVIAGQIIHPRADHTQRSGHQLCRPRAFCAMGCHIIHLPVITSLQPRIEMMFSIAQISISHSDLGKTQFRRPSGDG